ncbi:expressed unknown protein [Seminavis robusta]|uniref:Uncharacterized protein n=1 Tax=Seminavis robusta TaxID=568900 RepID=A0A9N8D4P3_9STRA|nr:expressed unknown protein [Seminavis robusta]|eukprot:Sro4_g003280.1 n/a (841) ;mRNA; r:101641-104163
MATAEAVGGNTSSSSNREARRQQQNNDDASTIMSLAAMSTTTATTTGALDDASSMGETTQTHHSSSRRKRKDDCSESRCTVTSEESVRSRSRRRRHNNHRLLGDTACHHRWLERIDRTAATSHAPIRPNRSAGDAFLPSLPQATASMMATPLSSASALTPFSIQNQRTFSATLPRIGGAGGLFPTTANETSAQAAARAGGSRCNDADVSAREVARCQSMSLPPTRPTRTRDDSKTDLMDDDDDDDSSSDDHDQTKDRKSNTGEHKNKEQKNDVAAKNHETAASASSSLRNNAEIDPYLFASLLHGQQLGGGRLPLAAPSMTHLHRSESSDHAKSCIPPKKPRRRSDADFYLMHASEKKPGPALTRYNTIDSSEAMRPSRTDTGHDGGGRTSAATSSSNSGNRACPQNKCQSLRGDSNCAHTVSPKPPAKPLRTFDDATCDRIVQTVGHLPMMPIHPPLNVEDAPSSPPTVPRVSDQSVARVQEMVATGRKDRLQKQASAASGMDMEEAEQTDCSDKEAKARAEKEGSPLAASSEEDDGVEVLVVEEDEDETEVSIQASLKEYDPDLFARLLNGDSSDSKVATIGLDFHTAEALLRTTEERQPPPPLVARVSSGTTRPPVYDRFDNSASCATPEHLAGAVKSSHPPLRPRRSIDECMIWGTSLHSSSLAAAAAAACVAQAEESTIMPAHGMPPPISLGRGRSFRRTSRRSTLPMASEMPSSGNPASSGTNGGGNFVERIDAATQEANLVAFSQPLEDSSGDVGEEIEDRDDEYEHPLEVAGDGAEGSYSRVLPTRRRRRVMRRFTMPSKGGSLSPQAKKRRMVGRSHSCYGPEDGLTTPAA